MITGVPMPAWMMIAVAFATVGVIAVMVLIGFAPHKRRKQHGFNVLPGEKRNEK
jgi:hypothetical protein